MEDVLAILFFILKIIFVIVIIIGIVYCFKTTDLETITFNATITHMDIDDGLCYISFICENGDTLVIRVSTEEYARLQVGNVCTIVRDGWHSIICGTTYRYLIEVVS